MPSYEYRDGRMVKVPDVVVAESGELREDVNRTLIVQNGVTLTVHGRISGTVEVSGGAVFVAQGDVSGTVSVASGAEATFYKHMSGTLRVSHGGVATLASSAQALGTMRIEGALVNYGIRGVQVTGPGTVDDREGSSVRQPDETWEDGTVVYYD